MSNVRQSPQARRNAVLLFAVLYQKGPITDKSGKATSILHAYLKANGYTVLRLTSLNSQMKRYEHCITKTVNGKRTYRIELVEIPEEFAAEVDAVAPTLVFRRPRKKPTADPVASAQSGPIPPPVIVPQPVEVPSAADIADQVLNLLVERLTAKPSVPETTDAPRLLIEANRKRQELQHAYDNLREDHSRLVTKTNRQESELARLRENVRILQEESQRGVSHEIQRAKDQFQRQAPEGQKGSD